MWGDKDIEMNEEEKTSSNTGLISSTTEDMLKGM
jgi:hypothetical protein